MRRRSVDQYGRTLTNAEEVEEGWRNIGVSLQADREEAKYSIGSER